ncbi:MAG: hypothetical protein CMM10_07195 [Rhodospirillaceae bacterium]|nr:hypothetical protein [Rhodospirillaceae bacterium]
MQIVAFDQDIIGAVGIVRIDAERIVVVDQLGVSGAQFAVPAGQAVIPAPLLAENFEFRGALGDGDKIVPGDQSGSQQSDDTGGGHPGKPPFELCVLGLIVSATIFSVTIAVNAIGHEQDDRDIGDPGDPECDDDGVIQRTPIRGKRRKPPGTPNMKNYGADC